MIEIKHRFTLNVLFACDAESVKDAVIQAKESGVNLRGVNLYRADLRWTDLRGVNLYGADLRWTDLRGADLRGADLRCVNLRGADLYGVNLSEADLRGADLYGVNLSEADLRGADLYNEKLRKNPLIITCLAYWCLITENHMKLGCQTHTHQEWGSFSDDEISEMDRKALEFWNVWKEPLLTMCKTHRGES